MFKHLIALVLAVLAVGWSRQQLPSSRQESTWVR